MFSGKRSSPATAATYGHGKLKVGAFEDEGVTGILDGTPLLKRSV